MYGGTFRYMTRVAAENQGLETSFVDLEGADDETILASFRPNTKVRQDLPLFKNKQINFLSSSSG